MQWLTRLPYAAPLPALSRRERLIVTVASALVALSRLLAVARSPWDWDEFLFLGGVREYDVVVHQPHPPGYPVFIAAAKLARLAVASDFRALQVVVVLSAVALCPLVFALARELRFDFTSALSAALLTAFLPNVWFYGGTAFSDVPALASGLGAVILLLAGCRSFPSYVGGAALLGLSAGIRPQNLLIGLVPALLALAVQWRHSLWRALGGVLAGAAVLVACYVGAALASESAGGFVEVVREQQEYVRNVDSFHNPGRPALGELASLFFLNPIRLSGYQNGVAIFSMVALLAGLIRKRARTLMVIALFGPFAVFAWLNLSFEAVTRYSVGYMPMHTLLIVEGIAVLAAVSRAQRVRAAVRYVLVAVAIVVLAAWTWPALRTVRTQDSPPFAALDWVHRQAGHETIFVDAALEPGGRYLLHDRNVKFIEGAPPFTDETASAWIVQYDALGSANSRRFSYPRGTLWKLARRRGFASSVERVGDEVRFADGWYGVEGGEHPTHRWMSRSGVMTLPELSTAGRLEIDAYVPSDTLKHPIDVTVEADGVVIDRFTTATPDIKRGWTLAPTGRPRAVRFTVSDVVVPAKFGNAGDTRELGLRLYASSWRAAR